MPTDTGMTYPFPYKTENGLFGEPPDPFVVQNLEVIHNAHVGETLAVDVAITTPTVTSNDVNATRVTSTVFIATANQNQYNTTGSDMDFTTADMNPEFNFKNQDAQTYFSTINAGEYKGTVTTNIASLNAPLLSTQTNTHTGSNNESGYSARTSTDQLDLVMKQTGRGQIRTSSDAFGLDITLPGPSKSLRLSTNAIDRLTVQDSGVDIPVLGANTPGSIAATTLTSTTLTTTNTSNVNPDSMTAPNQIAGGMVIAKTLLAGNIDKTPVGAVIPSTGQFTSLTATSIDGTPIGSTTPSTLRGTTINTTDTTDFTIDIGTNVVNSFSAPNNIAGGIGFQRIYAKELILYTPNSTDDALRVVRGNAALTTVTSDVIQTVELTATDITVQSPGDYDSTIPKPSISTLGGVFVTRGLSASVLKSRSTLDADSGFGIGSIVSQGGILAAKAISGLEIRARSTLDSDAFADTAPLYSDGGAIIKKALLSARIAVTDTTTASTTSGPFLCQGGAHFEKNIVSILTNNATSTTTGAVRLLGGLGVAKDVWADQFFGRKSTVTEELLLEGPSSQLTVEGSVDFEKDLYVKEHVRTGSLLISPSTSGTATTTIDSDGIDTSNILADEVRTIALKISNASSGTPTTKIDDTGFSTEKTATFNANITCGDIESTGTISANKVRAATNFKLASDDTVTPFTLINNEGIDTNNLHVVHNATIDELLQSDTLEVLGPGNSTSTSTGAVTITGGVGVAKDLWADNVFTSQGRFSSSTSSSSTSTGAVTITGGLGVGGKINTGSIQATTEIKIGNTTISPTSLITNNITINGTITNTEYSTLKSDVSTLKTDVSTLKTDMTTVKSNITSLDGRVTSLEGRVTATETVANGAASSATSAGTAAAAAQSTATAAAAAAGAADALAVAAGAAAASAQSTANSALTAAGAAQTSANTAQTTANSAVASAAALTIALGVTNGNLGTLTTRVNGIDGQLVPVLQVITRNTTTNLNDVTVSGVLTAANITAPTGAWTASSLHLTGSGTALSVDNNTTIGGTLDVTGIVTGTAATFSGNVGVVGFLKVGNASTPGRLKFASSSTDYTLLGVNSSDDVTNTRIILSGSARSGAAGVIQYISVGAGSTHDFFGSATTIATGSIRTGFLTLSGTGTALSVTNNVSIGGTLGVTGTCTLGVVSSGALSATTLTATAAGTALTVTNNANIGTLNLQGAGTALSVNNNATVGGNLTVLGSLAGGATTITTLSATNGTFSGTLGVTGTSTLGVLNSGAHSATTLTATGAGTALTVTNNVTVGGSVTAASFIGPTTGTHTGAIVGTTGSFSGALTGTSLVLSTTLNVTSFTTLGPLQVLNDASIGGDLGVIGDTSMNALNAASIICRGAGVAFNVFEDALIQGSLTVSTNMIISGMVPSIHFRNL